MLFVTHQMDGQEIRPLEVCRAKDIPEPMI